MYTIQDYKAEKIAVVCYSKDECDEFREEANGFIAEISYSSALNIIPSCKNGIAYRVYKGGTKWCAVDYYERIGLTVVPFYELNTKHGVRFEEDDFIAMIGG